MASGRWTENEMQYLRENVGRKRGRQMAEELGRHYNAVSAKVLYLGLQLGRARLSVQRKGALRPTWTPEQDATIRDNAHLGARAVAEMLGRTASGVNHRARRIGVSIKFVPRMEGRPRAPRQAPARVRKTVTVSRVEICGECGAPVSNWQQHFERLGHRRKAA